jgi:hypothetical protein
MIGIDAFCEAASRHSQVMFDNLGITINLAQLPSWERFDNCRHRMFGAGWLSRFWCAHLRPRLMPVRQAQIERAYSDALAQHQREFMTAILERAGANDK